MTNAPTAGRPQLEMRWLPVTDERGRTHMEATWVDASTLHAAPHHAA
ncbi:hypothetical protein [Nocardioides sp. MH1]